MTALHELQRRFAAAVTRSPAAPVSDWIKPGRLGAAQRLQIYRNNTFIALADALKTHFDVVAQLVGQDYFNKLARGYIHAHPPESACLRLYGNRFPAYLSDHECAQFLPYLSDVARLEWAMQESYHSPIATPLDTAALQTIAPPQYPELKFMLNPGARWVASIYPVLRIWQMHHNQHAQESLDLSQGGETVLVLRDELQVELMLLSPGAAAFVRALQNRLSLAQACAQAVAAEAGFAADRFFQECIKNRIIVDVQDVLISRSTRTCESEDCEPPGKENS